MIELICFDPLDFSSVTLIIHLFPKLTKAFIHFLMFLCIQFGKWIYFSGSLDKTSKKLEIMTQQSKYLIPTLNKVHKALV